MSSVMALTPVQFSSVCSEADKPANSTQMTFYVSPEKKQFVTSLMQAIAKPREKKFSSQLKLSEMESSNPIIRKIDQDFISSHENYRDQFTIAQASDLQISLDNINKSYYVQALIVGATIFAQKTSGHTKTKYAMAPVYMFVGMLWSLFKQKTIGHQIAQQENSVNKLKWLNAVEIKEEMRLESAKKSILERIRVIEQDLNLLASKNLPLTDVDLLNELKLYNKIWTNFSSDHLTIKSAEKTLLVTEYLELSLTQ